MLTEANANFSFIYYDKKHLNWQLHASVLDMANKEQKKKKKELHKLQFGLPATLLACDSITTVTSLQSNLDHDCN